MKKINPVTVFLILALQAIIVIYLSLNSSNVVMDENQATTAFIVQHDQPTGDFLEEYIHDWADEDLFIMPDAQLAAPDIIVDTRERIRLKYHSPLGYNREILVGTDTRATNSFDIGFDAPLIENNREDMYWLIDDSKCVIQGVSHFDKTQTLPIGLKVDQTGIISIQVARIENMQDEPDIFIKDGLTGETYPINDEAFELELEPGEYNDRFSIVFQPGWQDFDELGLVKGFQTYMNNELSEIHINKVVDSDVLSVDLYNLLGQRVNSWNTELNGRHVALPVHSRSGIYILNVNTEHGRLNKKIIIQ